MDSLITEEGFGKTSFLALIHPGLYYSRALEVQALIKLTPSLDHDLKPSLDWLDFKIPFI